MLHTSVSRTGSLIPTSFCPGTMPSAAASGSTAETTTCMDHDRSLLSGLASHDGWCKHLQPGLFRLALAATGPALPHAQAATQAQLAQCQVRGLKILQLQP
jgi:hypothetical protein